MRVVLLVGLPGAGKSTYARHHLAGATLVSLDRLRTRARERRVFAEALARGEDIVVDDTNLRREVRRRFIEPARAAGAEVDAVWVRTPLETCLARNRARDESERVPAGAIVRMHRELEPPSPEEGLRSIITADERER